MAVLISDAELSDFKKRVGRIEEGMRELTKAAGEQTKELIKRIEHFDLLLVQLNRHVNPTREQLVLHKRTIRELTRELKKVHGLLGKQEYNL